MSEGYRLITTTYTYFRSKEEAKAEAFRRRSEGKRTEVITETEYNTKYFGKQMQDLTKL